LETGEDPISNAGAENYLVKLGDKEKEVPFTGITDSKGKMMNSQLGLPSSPDEVNSFMKMLKQGAPKMTSADQKAIETQVRKTFAD
jgi:hypothetical protein